MLNIEKASGTQEAAECTLRNDGDDQACEAEWQKVKDLSEEADEG